MPREMYLLYKLRTQRHPPRHKNRYRIQLKRSTENAPTPRETEALRSNQHILLTPEASPVALR